MAKKKIRLGIIFGGKSSEHEVSLRSARQVMDALNPERYEVVPIAITKGGQWLVGEKGHIYLASNLALADKEGGVLISKSQELVTTHPESRGLTNFVEGEVVNEKIDLILPIGHGTYIEDGKLQGMLEMAGIPYVFSDVLASAIAMNKSKAKIIARSVSIPVAKGMTLRKGKKYSAEKIAAKLGLPLFVKPGELGSSVGLSLANNPVELASSIEQAFIHGQEVLIEQFVKGRELTVAVIGDERPKALPVVEIIPKLSGFYDYKSKYQEGGSEHVIPANIPETVRKNAQRLAVKAFKVLGCRDLARADFIWSEVDGKLYFLEMNTIPGMTEFSLAPQAAASAGIKFGEFLDMLIKGALKRSEENKSIDLDYE